MRKPRAADRRQEPRRAEDAALHYATVRLVNAALECAEASRETWVETDTALRDAAADYRAAERFAQEVPA